MTRSQRLNELITDEMRMRCSPQLALGYGEPGDELLRLLQEHDADMCVLSITRRNPIDLTVFGSTARRLIRNGGHPVLAVGPSKTSLTIRSRKALGRVASTELEVAAIS